MNRIPIDPIADRVARYLDRCGLAAEGARVVPLTGDASDRRYYRVLRRGRPSIVLQVYAQPFDYPSLTFVNVAELFRRVPMPIPAILDHQDDLGILSLEDLGDVTLQASVGATSPEGHAALYRTAVALIARLQHRGAELASSDYAPYAVSFDVEKLTWELEFFTRHFLEAYRGVRIAEADRARLRAEFGGLVDELAAEPRVVCHRDYHSRNLMVHDGTLYVIDFQDARLGPDTYDLVSLLRDSYVELGEATIAELVAYFLALKGQPGDEAAFRARFDVMAFQRNLKALGTFGYQAATRGNPVYIQYIPRTLRYVRDALTANPRLSGLAALLAGWVDELRPSSR